MKRRNQEKREIGNVMTGKKGRKKIIDRAKRKKSMCEGETERNRWRKKQGRIHGNPVADGWAGAVMRKPHRI